jgi:hypothetical protein
MLDEIPADVLHGSPSMTLDDVIDAIVSADVRIQSLEPVLQVQVRRSVSDEYALESSVVAFGFLSHGVEKFGRPFPRKVKHRPVLSRISTPIGIDDVSPRSLPHPVG